MITIEYWGAIDYRTAWERQKQLQELVQRGKRDSTLVLCEHPTVITIGKNGGRHNIVWSDEELATKSVDVVEINRGGDVTLHNRGQLVGYTIFRLTDFKPDLHWFLREMEQCIIETITAWGITGERYDGYTGVWVDAALPAARKICAIGIHCSRWVTAHGFALNVANDTQEFSAIIPCGISDKAVTSMQQERRLFQGVSSSVAEMSNIIELDFERVQQRCAEIFFKHFS
jgi:lipoyl(octanoyl) transferase